MLRQRLREALLQFRDAPSLPLHPLLAQRAPLGFELPRLLRQLALHLLHFVAAAMQIGDQSGGLARFGRDQLACARSTTLSGNPSRRAMSMPLDPPGTPTRSR